MIDKIDEPLEEKIAALSRTLSWMDLVMANVNESILVIDKDWRVVFINSYTAELLGQNRVLLLGKYFWEAVPFDIASPVTGSESASSIKSISKFDGVYDLEVKSVQLKMLLRGKYVEPLQQAICIMSDVSVELEASSELMKAHKRIAGLEAKLTRQKL